MFHPLQEPVNPMESVHRVCTHTVPIHSLQTELCTIMPVMYPFNTCSMDYLLNIRSSNVKVNQSCSFDVGKEVITWGVSCYIIIFQTSIRIINKIWKLIEQIKNKKIMDIAVG